MSKDFLIKHETTTSLNYLHERQTALGINPCAQTIDCSILNIFPSVSDYCNACNPVLTARPQASKEYLAQASDHSISKGLAQSSPILKARHCPERTHYFRLRTDFTVRPRSYHSLSPMLHHWDVLHTNDGGTQAQEVDKL